MSDIEIGSEWVQKKKTPKEFEVVVLSGDSLMVKENGEGFSIPWYTSDFLEHHEPKVKADMVSHPPHYKDASGIECIEVTQHMRFCEGNSFKYVYRAGSKGNLIEDLKKAAWYAERSWTRSRSGNDRIHWLVQRKGEAIADSRDKQGKTFAAGVIRNIVNNRWWQAYDMLMTEIARLEGE